MPWPEAFVVNIGSKAREATSLSIPMPVSVTSSRTNRPGSTPGIGERLRRPELGVAGLERQRAATRHRVARVDREVDQDLLDPGRVVGERPEVGLEAALDDDVLADRRAEEAVEARDQLVQVEDDLGAALPAREDHQLADEADPALGGAPDLLDVGGRGRPRRHRALGEPGVVDDHAEDVVEVVSDAAGELADDLKGRLPVAVLPRRHPAGGTHSSRPQRIAVATAAARSETPSFS